MIYRKMKLEKEADYCTPVYLYILPYQNLD